MTIRYIYRFGITAWLAGVSLLAIAQTAPSNKPSTATQVPAADTVVPTPSGYVVGSQSPLVNLIRERDAMGRITNSAVFGGAGYVDVKETGQYFDGLGRPAQVVNRQITPGNAPLDLVTPVEYDAYGRERYKYLPYVPAAGNNNDGGFKLDPFNDQKHFYQSVYPLEQPSYTGEQVYYSQTQYEASPLNRVVMTMAPGNSWAGKGKGIGQQYMVNGTADSVVIWSIAGDTLTYVNNDISTNIPLKTGYYAAGQLYKHVTTDEQGHAVVEYKDQQGLVVLKKSASGVHSIGFLRLSGVVEYVLYLR